MLVLTGNVEIKMKFLKTRNGQRYPKIVGGVFLFAITLSAAHFSSAVNSGEVGCSFTASNVIYLSHRGSISSERLINSAASGTYIVIDEDVVLNKPLMPADGVSLVGNGEVTIRAGKLNGPLISSMSRLAISDIRLIGGNRAVVQRSGELRGCNVSVQEAKKDGILVAGDANFHLVNIAALNNGVSGLSIRDRARGEVRGGIYNQNRSSGISENSINSVLINNIQASKNRRHGLTVLQRSRNTMVFDSVFNENGGNGVVMGRSRPELRDAAADWVFRNITANGNARNGFSVDVVIHKDPTVFPVRGQVENLKTHFNKRNGVNINYASFMRFSFIETANNGKNGLIGISLADTQIDGLTSKNNGTWGINFTASRVPNVSHGRRVSLFNKLISGNRVGEARIHPSYKDSQL